MTDSLFQLVPDTQPVRDVDWREIAEEGRRLRGYEPQHLNEDRIAGLSNRKARVGDQMLYEVRNKYGLQTYVHDQHLDISFDEAVLRASAGERLWEPWF